MKDKKVELFKAGDFYRPDCFGFGAPLAEPVADIANYILNKKLAECPRVYGKTDDVNDPRKHSVRWSTNEYDSTSGSKNTHTALLFDVQPIVEESSADVFKEWLEMIRGFKGPYSFEKEIIERAEAALKREGKL